MQSSQRLPGLDGVRGIASLGVVLFHLTHALYGGKLFIGDLFVDLFFILSGFVLSHVYEASLATKKVTSSRFLGHRIARLYPVHIVVLLVGLISFAAYTPHAWWADHTSRVVRSIAAHLLMSQHLFFPTLSFYNGTAWSVSVEFWLNLLWIFIIWIFPTAKARNSIYLWLVLGAIGWMLLVQHNVAFDLWDGSYGSVRGILGFFLGCNLYQFYPRITALSSKTINLISLPVVLGICLCLSPAFSFAHADSGSNLECVLILFPLLLVCALHGQSVLGKVLSSSPLVWLGEVSYSMYLWHMVILVTILNVWGNHGHTFATTYPLFLLILGAVFAVSATSYYLLEVPSRKYLRRKFDALTQKQ